MVDMQADVKIAANGATWKRSVTGPFFHICKGYYPPFAANAMTTSGHMYQPERSPRLFERSFREAAGAAGHDDGLRQKSLIGWCDRLQRIRSVKSISAPEEFK
jgi:hypothetical protein